MNKYTKCTDFIRQSINICDTVFFASGVGHSSRKLGTGVIIDLRDQRRGHCSCKIKSNISEKTIFRDNKNIVNMQGLKESSPEFFI